MDNKEILTKAIASDLVWEMGLEIEKAKEKAEKIVNDNPCLQKSLITYEARLYCQKPVVDFYYYKLGKVQLRTFSIEV